MSSAMSIGSAIANPQRRAVLVALTIGFCLVGLGIATLPFFKSLALNDVAQANHEMEVSTQNIPLNGVKAAYWKGYKVFLVRPNGKLEVFVMPLYSRDGNAVALHDHIWPMAPVQCLNFMLSQDIFQCLDPGFEGNPTWRWTVHGKSLTSLIPDMQIPVYVVAKDRVVLGRSTLSTSQKYSPL